MSSAPRFDVIVAGAGIAGLSAATITAQDGLATVVLDRMGLGGKLINLDKIENFVGAPGATGPDLAGFIGEQALDAGVETRLEQITRIEPGDPHQVVTTEGRYSARAVILALGAELARPGLPGEEAFEGRGVSYCATCDAEFFRDQPVAVIGGGDSAADEALYLADIASRVDLVFMEPAMHAFERTQRLLLEREAVRLIPNARVTRIEGGNDGVTGLIMEVDGAEQGLQTNGVFIYAGLTPNSEPLRGVVEIDGAGHVTVDRWMRTAVPGIFAIGDLRARSPRMLISAAGDGAVAAVAAAQYLGKRDGPAATWGRD